MADDNVVTYGIPPAFLEDYKQYLILERNLSPNTLDGYSNDLRHLSEYAEMAQINVLEMKYDDLQAFLSYLFDLGICVSSISRIVSGIKSFYRFMQIEEIITDNPTDLLETPGKGKKLPVVLTVEEVDSIIDSIDTSTPNGIRNAAMIELLYSCGLRVSELCDLTFASIFLDDAFVRVEGKGSKERLVPMSDSAIQRIRDYIPIRQLITAKPDYTHYLFLSRNRMNISRQMVFMIIKDLAKQAGVEKNISPHTFRHSFATHLLEGGANLLAIRDMLGHVNLATTEIYTHIDRTQLRKEILTYHPRNH